jgi:hypothetical protein
MPAVAAAASWMEALNMPSREIRRRFTRSDMAIMGWRSAEMSANMRDKTVQLPSSMDGEVQHSKFESVDHDTVLKNIEDRLGGIVYKMVDERGEIDLRKLTGEEACTYLNVIGVPVIRM